MVKEKHFDTYPLGILALFMEPLNSGSSYYKHMKLTDNKIQKIAIFRALQLGDMLCAIPAIRALRHAFPQAHISLIGLPGAQVLVKRFPQYFDSFINFPGYPGLPEQGFDPTDFELFIAEIRSWKPDLVLQMQGNGTIVNYMIERFGATYTAGFCPVAEDENDFFLTYPNHSHELTRHLALMEHLGIPAKGHEMEFPITAEDEAAFQALNLDVETGNYICIHPGSKGVWRQWPPLYFAAIGNFCMDLGYQVVITGTKEELKLAQEVASLMEVKPIVSSGKTSLGALAVLIQRSFALVANCTGVSHMAAALRSPSVIISMDGEPDRWAPIDKSLHKTIDWTVNPDYDAVVNALSALLPQTQE